MTDYLNVLQANVDETSKKHLAKAAKWAKLAAVLGFAILGALVILGITLLLKPSKHIVMNVPFSILEKLGMAIYYLFIGGTIFYPCFLLNRFSDNINHGINRDQRQYYIQAFKSLKNLFRFMALMTIVWLLIFALFILVNGNDILRLSH